MNNNTLKTFINKKEKQVLKIEFSEFCDSPREWDNLGTFYTFENRYSSPDKHNYSDGLDALADLLGDYVYTIHKKHNNTRSFFEHVQKYASRKNILIYPVTRYEHGQVRYFLGVASGFDYGTVGFIYATKEKVFNWCKCNNKNWKKIATDIFDSELESYNQYANGEVYDIELENENGEVVDCLCVNYIDDIVYDNEKLLDYVSENFGINKKDFIEVDNLEKITTVQYVF